MSESHAEELDFTHADCVPRNKVIPVWTPRVEILDGPAPKPRKGARCPLCGERLPSTAESTSPSNCPSCFPGGYLMRDAMIERAKQEGLATDAWFGLPGEVVSRLAPHTEATPPALLMNLLVHFGNRIGPQAYVTRGGMQHPARLNVLIVGPTSIGRKGTSTAEIEQVMRYGGPRFGLSTGEGLVNALMHMERDGEQLPWVPVIESEFAKCLVVMRRQNNNLSQIIRGLWDTGSAAVTTRKDPLEVKRAHVSIIGHITPSELKREIDQVELENGFANRFLWCYSQRWHELPHGGNPPYDEVRGIIAEGLERAATLDGEMTFDGMALVEWESAYREATERRRPSPWAEIAGRPEAQMLRLCVTYALMDGTTTIQGSHVRAAKAVWDYSDHVTQVLFLGAPMSKQEASLHRWLPHKGRATRTEVRRHLSNIAPDVLDELRENMTEKGLIRIEKERRAKGRSIEWWIWEM